MPAFACTRRTARIALAALVLTGLALHAAPAEGSAAPEGVVAVQRRLVVLGYLPTDAGAVSGRLDDRTMQAILAFQGWEGLERDGVVGPATASRLATARRPTPLPGAGARIEVHLERQVALLVREMRVLRAIHVSTGASATPTPTGDFRVYRKQPESWSVPYRVWMPWASYFTGGFALHGDADVPAYRASHGCVRVPLAEARAVYMFARLGVAVRVLS